MEIKRTFVILDQDAIDRGMTAPDIMEWIRNEVTKIYGPNAIVRELDSEYLVDGSRKIGITVSEDE